MKTITRRGLLTISFRGSSLGTHYPEGPPSAAFQVMTRIRLCFLCFLLLTAPSFAAKPAPPPPPPPPIRYEIKFLDYQAASPDYVSVSDLNDAGQIVGSYPTLDGERHGFLYDSATDTILDLHTAYSGPGSPVPPGWTISSGRGINGDGVIVGKLLEIGNPNGIPSIPYILDPRTMTQIVLLPFYGPPGSTTGYLRINNNWDILTIYHNADDTQGAYVFNYLEFLLGNDTPEFLPGLIDGRSPVAINNPTATRAAQVSGKLSNGSTVFRWTIGASGGVQTFADLPRPVRDINDSGVICGDTSYRGKQYPMRLLDSTPNLLTGAPDHWAQSINNDGDVLLYSSSTNLIFHNEKGYFDLDKLVTGTAEDVADWLAGAPYPTLLNNRDEFLDFGQIAGTITLPDGTMRGFVLTPITP